jgi:riboflavin synthase
MFTGLVQALARVVDVRDEPPGKKLMVDVTAAPRTTAVGDSVALNGCCLTAVDVNGQRLAFEAGPETLARTTLGRLAAGNQVNLEWPLRVGDPLGGHWVTGHVDAIGTLVARQNEAAWATYWITAPPALVRQMASKGSIAIDGVSLTLVEVATDRFSVALIPHTLQVTTLGRLQTGDAVNLETDVLAKYVEQQLAFRR